MSIGLVFLAGCSGSRIGSEFARDPNVVAVIGGRPLTLAEFERRYAKSVGGRAEAAADSSSDYRDFLERYVDFRLKVRAARDAGLDKDSALVAEMTTYRDQFARPFLLDKEVLDPLIRRMHELEQKMVDVSHILIRVPEAAQPGDTLTAWKKLSAIRDSILTGADFAEMAIRHSEDPSAKASPLGAGYRGRLGFIRGGRLVPAFESVAFSIPLGEISHVFRTQYGYHILLVHGREPAASDVRIAHLMVKPTEDDSAGAWTKIRQMQDSLRAGVEFAALAARHSDDKGSARNGGDLGFVSIDGRLIPSLKKAAFGLENIGDVSQPAETPFGIHLVQLTERRQPRSLEDSYDDLRRRASRSPQMKLEEESFGRSILDEAGFTADTLALLDHFGDVTADSAAKRLAGGGYADGWESTVIATIGSSEYTVTEFVRWAQKNPISAATGLPSYVNQLIDGFLVSKAIDYKVSRLEDDNEEFRTTMADFTDGLLLFRIMDDSVWSKASGDSTELLRRYNLNPEQYVYPDRHRLIGLFSRQKAYADSTESLLESGASIHEIVAALTDSAGAKIRVDTTLVTGETNSAFDRALDLEVGKWTGSLPYNRGFIVIVNDGIEPSRTKNFDEARTEIVNEYQNDLEARLVQRLRQRYGAVTFPPKVDTAFESDRSMLTMTGADPN